MRILIVAVLSAIYATCYAAVKAGLPFAPPLWFGGLRALIAGLALFGLMIILRQQLFPARREWPLLLTLALTATTLAFGAMFLSPGRTGVGIASLLGNLQPLLVIGLAGLFLREPLTRDKAVALALGLTGAALIAAPALTGPDAFGISGAVLALVASVSLAVGMVLVKRMGTPPNLLILTAWQSTIGSLPLLAISALVERDAAVDWTVEFVGLLLFLALVGTSLTTVVWYWLLQRGDVGRLVLFLFLVPIFGLGVGTFLFGETLGLLSVIGVVVTVSGIAFVARPGETSHWSPRKLGE
ncbi:EamA family transporter [Rubrobacter tropicus]|uniref:EamA family transporter n=1 Tax=Rubrobacter tropicus TaxID=2653851 RepID=A0A6G8QDA1_9ACTN|nr:DMT family transporter [Rubrobacter tropicus]QIN84459.1 EamA family transporter [Rubrobacter tropicus]